MMADRIESDFAVAVDTSVASLWFKRRQPDAGRYRELVSGLSLALPAIAKAELLYGAYRGGWSSNNVMALRSYIDGYEILPIDQKTLETWAVLRSECRRLGIGSSENDAWNAALLSHDRDHIRMQSAVPQLRVLSLLG